MADIMHLLHRGRGKDDAKSQTWSPQLLRMSERVGWARELNHSSEVAAAMLRRSLLTWRLLVSRSTSWAGSAVLAPAAEQQQNNMSHV